MRIIISPAKKMNREEDSLECLGMPFFLKDAEKIMQWMQTLSLTEAKTLWGCNDTLAEMNFRRFQEMDLYKRLTPAILSYEGIQYQYMAPAVFETGMLTYIQEHLRILSGFYGVLKPMDGVTPYRLEMQAKAKAGGKRDLYEFWGERIYQQIIEDDDRVIINLASKEYSKCVESYLLPQDTFITCTFGEVSGEKIVQKGTYAKMVRGEMVRYMAEKNITDPQQMKNFDRLGYHFQEEWSTEDNFVFIKEGKNGDRDTQEQPENNGA